MRTVEVDAARLRGWLAGFSERHGAVLTDPAPEQVLITGADGARAWIDVPFGPLSGELADHVERPRRIGVLLVRRGGYAAGVFDGRRLTASKVGSAYVQGTTKAGGWSQQRYARRRDNQSQKAFAEAADAAAKVLLGQRLDALVRGGDKAAVASALGDTRLRELADLPAGRFLTVPDPRLRVLNATPAQFLSVHIALEP